MKTNTATTKSLRNMFDPAVDQVITADAQFRPIAPVVAKRGYELDELYRAIGADIVQIIEVQRIPGALGRKILVCDEEGIFNGKSINRFASALAGTPIVGDVLYCASKNVK